ncbi:MAG: DNA repair protein RecO [Ignavibacteriae bacterium]|nr:DNA repair protein RecO [Ignavibacteriota bacterium]
MIVTDEAIILHSRKFSETSKILTVYSLQHGKLSLIAKGARNPKSKFGASLEALNHSTLTIYKKSQRDLHLLSKAETTVPLRRLAEDYDRLTIGLAIAELVSVTQELEEVNAPIFRLLASTLELLNSASGNEYALLVAFQIRLAEIMGFAPNFLICFETGERVVPLEKGEFIFSITDGSVMSPEIGQYREGFRFEPQTLHILQRLSECPIAETLNYELTELQKSHIHDFFAQYFGFHLDRRFHYRTSKLILQQ